MVARGQTRAHGETTAEDVTREQSEALTEPPDATLPGDEPRSRHRTPGFARMRTTWNGDDHLVFQHARDAVEERILHNFTGAFEVMNQVYEIVRTPETHPVTGEVLRDAHGFVVWVQTPNGTYDEDFTRLTTAQREHLLFLITTRLFEWSQAAADAWLEAMLAKSQWEERFALGFDAPATGTIEARTAQGNIAAREERYFAIFVSAYSRKADAVVKSMELLAQRLKDVMTA